MLSIYDGGVTWGDFNSLNFPPLCCNLCSRGGGAGTKTELRLQGICLGCRLWGRTESDTTDAT